MAQEEDQGTVELNNKWRLFVELVQIVWAEGEIPQQMG